MTPEQRVALSRAGDASERKAIEDVRAHGLHILHVFDDAGEQPDFSYTVGLWHTHRHPEVLIVGLKDELCHWVLNEINRQIAVGKSFVSGTSALELLEGFRVYFEALPCTTFREYFGWNRWFYDGDEFEAVQMIWPSTTGVFPWQSEANDYLRWAEPILTKTPLLVS